MLTIPFFTRTAPDLPRPTILAGDIVRHPASGRIGKVISIGRLSAKVQQADMTAFRAPVAELRPASFEEEAAFYESLVFDTYAIDGDVIQVLPDGGRALVLERSKNSPYYGMCGDWLYIARLLGPTPAVDGFSFVLGRDYLLDWIPAAEAFVVADDGFEADANAMLDFVLKRETALPV